MIEKFSASFTLIISINIQPLITMHNSSTTRVKTMADIDMRTSGMYSGSNYLNRQYQKKKSPMKLNRSVYRKVEDTTKERSVIQKLKKTGKIGEKYEIDLFAQRPSQLESSIHNLEQKIRQLKVDRLKYAELLTKQINQKVLSMLAQTYESIQDQLVQLKKELQTKKDKRLNAVQRNDAANE